MRSITLLKYAEKWRLRAVPLPAFSPSDLLIKVLYAPINPSDLYFSYGVYGVRPPPPITLGMEGVGIVTEVGKDVSKKYLNQKVAFMVKNENFGSFAEFTVSNPRNVMILKGDEKEIMKNMIEEGDIKSEQKNNDFFNKDEKFETIHKDEELMKKAGMFINPMTVLGFWEIIEKGEHKAVIQTGGNSSVGRMLSKFLKEKNIKNISTVRSNDQIESLLQMGADKVLSTDSQNFLPELKNVVDEYKPTIFFDCVGGSLTGQIFTLLPMSSTCISYGGLSHKLISDIDFNSLIFHKKKIEGFWLKNWMKNKTDEELEKLKQTEIVGKKNVFDGNVGAVFSLEKSDEALKEMRERKIKGKILFQL